jgi:hypothetical protein
MRLPLVAREREPPPIGGRPVASNPNPPDGNKPALLKSPPGEEEKGSDAASVPLAHALALSEAEAVAAEEEAPVLDMLLPWAKDVSAERTA